MNNNSIQINSNNVIQQYFGGGFVDPQKPKKKRKNSKEEQAIVLFKQGHSNEDVCAMLDIGIEQCRKYSTKVNAINGVTDKRLHRTVRNNDYKNDDVLIAAKFNPNKYKKDMHVLIYGKEAVITHVFDSEIYYLLVGINGEFICQSKITAEDTLYSKNAIQILKLSN